MTTEQKFEEYQTAVGRLLDEKQRTVELLDELVSTVDNDRGLMGGLAWAVRDQASELRDFIAKDGDGSGFTFAMVDQMARELHVLVRAAIDNRKEAVRV